MKIKFMKRVDLNFEKLLQTKYDSDPNLLFQKF